MKGNVFNIQRFSIHDGPGIRTSVFLKGCNLRCLWCHNPESNSPRQEIQYFQSKCTMCLKCMEVCPQGAFSLSLDGVKEFDRSKCDLCGECVKVCMYDALVFVSKLMEPDQVVDVVRRDIDYYRNSGGGLTISGGEPLLQREFVRQIFERTRALGIHNAIDTAANLPWEDLEYILPIVDLVLLDLKVMDSSIHRQATGVGNARILENARRLAYEDVDLIIRIPIVPGYNNTIENMDETARFLQGFPHLMYVELLPYHDLGVDKHASLGKAGEGAIFEIPPTEHIASLAEVFSAYQIPVVHG